MKFSTIKEVKLEDDNNFSVILQLENTTNDTINARLGLKIPSAIRSYSQDNLQIKINPNKKAFIPMQFTVNKSQMAGKLDLEFSIIDFLSKKEIGKSVTSVVVLQKRNIKIFPVQSNIFYRQEGDSIHYELKVMNMGNQAEEILLTNVLPDFRGNFTSENKRIIVEAFQEKIVRFSKYVDRDMMKIESFQANVSGYTTTKDFAGNVFFTIQNASSNRVYRDPTMLNQNWTNFSTNYVRLTARDINSANANYNLMAHQEFSVGLNEFAYNINGTTWNNDQDMVLTDSWVKYQRKDKGILIGSINNNDFDIPINGRGVMLFNNYDKNDNRIVVEQSKKIIIY
ncbi:COG1470 family protein [Empedobacter falsenii]